MMPLGRDYIAGWEVRIKGAEGIRKVSKIFVFRGIYSSKARIYSLAPQKKVRFFFHTFFLKRTKKGPEEVN